MGTTVNPPFHGDGVKVAGWSVWWWQSHADLENCKRQFRGFLWNWRFPSFKPVDWMVWGFHSIVVIETIMIIVTFVVRTVFLCVYTIQVVELVMMDVKYNYKQPMVCRMVWPSLVFRYIWGYICAACTLSECPFVGGQAVVVVCSIGHRTAVTWG